MRGEAADRFDRSLDKLHGYIISNEQTLFECGPWIADKTGTAIAVGMDQGFDLLAMAPKLDRLVVVDVDRRTSALSEGMMVAASRLRRLHRAVAGDDAAELEPQRLVEAFRGMNLGRTLIALRRYFRSAGMDHEIEQALRPVPERPQIDAYLDFKAQAHQTGGGVPYVSWLSSAANLNHVIDLYEAGGIRFEHADMTDPGKLLGDMSRAGGEVSVIYLSNAGDVGYIDSMRRKDTKIPQLMHALSSLPLAEDAVVIRSHLDAISLMRPAPIPAFYRGRSAMLNGTTRWAMSIETWDAFSRFRTREEATALAQKRPPASDATAIVEVKPGLYVSKALAHKAQIAKI